MKLDHKMKKFLEKNLMENVKELMDTLPINDEFDAIILATLITQYTEVDIFNLFSGTAELDDIPKFGINEIARLVKKHMAYKTAINHTQKLIKEGYLIDINQLIIEKIEEITPIITNNDKILYKITLTLVGEELESLIEKYEKTKRMLIVNFEKIA
jgi:hypothetical protein